MHIEPGVVDAAKITFSYGTAALVSGLALQTAFRSICKNTAAGTLMLRVVTTTLLTFCFFELLPHRPVGVSEVHLILGTTLYLLFGLAPAALGLAGGLLAQGLLFAPTDLPQYGMNLTTLLAPLFVLHLLAKRVIPEQTAYVDLGYAQVLKLSAAYQGGIVAWVAFWAFYGQGFGAENLAEVGSFGLAYLGVILVEPLIDLAVLAAAKSLRGLKGSALLERRLYEAHAA
ncbi:MAG: energy-coupling factor ABC transporter permease [Betaproteobacteria bacterium]|nr:energy-coupling factor ABC transporter permease [Betaproteobacteria bacterium]